ncbi:ABC transporter substrate-binding protein [Sodalis sp. RH24]|uniref:ABC transporter substrate-binding protein n=1 Tax=unclassified Sodalis (in: enterobacteria) TaxID=2636512 RepID=UPI003965BBD3
MCHVLRLALSGKARQLRLLGCAALLSVAGSLPAVALADTVNIAFSAAVTTLDPQQATVVQTDLSVISHIYSPLVIRNPDLGITGVVAQSWQAIDDNTWDFKLRPGITFANGKPLDAAVVKWNFDHLLDPAHKTRVKEWYSLIDHVDVVAPDEVKIITRMPFPGLVAQLSMLFMMEPSWTATHDPSREAMGSGPYQLAEYVPGERVVLTPNPTYFGTQVFGTPAPHDKVVLRMISEPAVRVSALLAGELDLALDIPPTDIARINSSGIAHAGWGESSRAMIIKMNNLKPPFANNLKLRQAMNYAIDRQGIIDAIYNGHGAISKGQLLSPMYFGYNDKLQPYPYDPDKARQLIAESGLPQPISFELQVPLGRYLLSQEIGQVIAAQLQEVGLNVSIKEMEYANWSNAYTRGDMGQAAFLGQAWPTLDADGLLGLYLPTDPGAYWKDDVFAGLVMKGRSTVDKQKRAAWYQQATERMREQAPLVFLFNQPLTYATSKRFTWQTRGDDWVRVFDLVAK